MSTEVASLNKEADNSINFRRAFLVGGISVAWGIISPASPLGYLAAMISGTVGSAFAYPLGEIAYKYYNKWCHRAAAPLLVGEKTPHYEQSLKNAFEKLKDHPYYDLFKKIKRYKNDEEAFPFFKNRFQLGYCFGSVVSLLPLIESNPHASCSDLLKALDLERVFYFQLVHIMLAGFQVSEQMVRRKAEIARSPCFSPENFLKHAQGLPLEAEDPKKIQQAEKLEKSAESLQKIIADIQKSFIAWEEVQSVPFSIKESPQAIRLNLEQIIKTQNIAANSPIIGRIILQGDPQDRLQENYRAGHTVLFQCSPGRFRFYDTIDNIDGGFYEYDDPAEFYEALRTQLLEDPMQKNPQIQLCIKKES